VTSLSFRKSDAGQSFIEGLSGHLKKNGTNWL